MSTKALMVQGQAVNLDVLPNIRQFIASKAGITLPPTVKGVPGPTTKEVVALCIAAGRTEEQIKADRKELDVRRTAHYVKSGMVVAMLAADPSLRKSVKQSFNKNGECIGASATFRKERVASIGSATRIAQLEATIAQLTARLGAPALPA